MNGANQLHYNCDHLSLIDHEWAKHLMMSSSGMIGNTFMLWTLTVPRVAITMAVPTVYCRVGNVQGQ